MQGNDNELKLSHPQQQSVSQCETVGSGLVEKHGGIKRKRTPD